MQANTERHQQALNLWDHLFGDLKGYLCISSANRLYDENGMPILKPTKDQRKETGFKDEFYCYPEQARDAIDRALDLSDEGREAWFCKHLLTLPRRLAENATGILALGNEYDGPPLPDGNLTPTAWVLSSPDPDHYHGYWGLERPLNPEPCVNLNHKLSKKTGGDKWALASLLRVPGTRNYKYAHKDVRFTDSPIVQLMEVTDKRYTPGELQDTLKDVVLQEEKTISNPHPKGDKRRPPVAMTRDDLSIWAGKKPVTKSDGTIDVSESLFQIGLLLWRYKFIDEDYFISALKERDESLGWEKYSDRGSDKEYRRIYNKLSADNPAPHILFGDASDSNGNRAGAESQPKKGRRMDVSTASSITQRGIEWFWKGWLAKGKLSLWDGDPGVGKSLATTSIASILTNGGTLPGGSEVEPMNVLLCNLEDGSDDTIVPRLASAGANLNRVFVFNEAYDKDDNPMLLQFPRDIDLLGRV